MVTLGRVFYKLSCDQNIKVILEIRIGNKEKLELDTQNFQLYYNRALDYSRSSDKIRPN